MTEDWVMVFWFVMKNKVPGVWFWAYVQAIARDEYFTLFDIMNTTRYDDVESICRMCQV
jgi:hypothetical protein